MMDQEKINEVLNRASKTNFMEYTKTREKLGLNKKKIDKESKQIEYLQKKQQEINEKMIEYERKGDLRYLTKMNKENNSRINKSEKEIASELKRSLNNGLIVGNGYNFTKEYLEHKDLTKERNNYTYSYSSNTDAVIQKRIEYEERLKVKKMENEDIFVTEEGFKKLQEELTYLKTQKRDEISEKIKIAKSYGDLSENGEYEEAKESQEANESKISELEYMIKYAKIIDKEELETETVEVGNTVYITNISTNKEQKYTIVGTAESNILEGKISNQSPIGKSLLGAKVGDIVQVEAPIGIIEYKIKKITLE